jgi:hypothetical protein
VSITQAALTAPEQTAPARIARPLTGQVKSARIRTGASTTAQPKDGAPSGQVSSFDFSLPNNNLQAGLDSPSFDSGIETRLGKPQSSSMDKFFEPARAPALNSQLNATPQPAPAGSPGNDSPTSSTASDYDQQLKIIIVRMTGFNEDPEITPKINLDAVSMANKLLETKRRKCVILLERTGVKLGTNGYTDMSVNGNLVDFRKLLKAFMASGGEIVLNKKWCDEFAVQQSGIIGGIKILPQNEIAELIVDAEKIVDYATPNYPANLKFFFNQPGAPAH